MMKFQKEKKNVFRELDFWSKLYIIIFLMIMFSGSTFLSQAVMPLVCILIFFLACMIFIKDIQSNANRNKKIYLIQIIIILIILFLIYQRRISFNPQTTTVFIQRFLVLSLLLVFVPTVDLNYKVIKAIKYYSYFVSISIIFMTLVTGTKSGGIVGSFQFAGMLMSISFGVFLIDYYIDKNKIDLIGLALCFLALLMSGKRTFTMLAIIAYVLIFYILRDKKRTIKFLKLSFIMMVILGIAFLTIPAVRLVGKRIIEFSGDNTYNGRSYYWIAAFDIFKNHKMLGIGMGCFAEYFDLFFHRLGNLEAYDAHNIYIQMLAEVGILGEMLFISMFLVTLINSLLLLRKRYIRENEKCIYVLSYSIYLQVWFLIYGLTGNPLYGASQLFFYMTAVSMIVSLKLFERKYRIKYK